jgi:phosphatidylserine/phosphatidylglycerophosphate/cardiolipin synthase-like enzyme
MYALTSREIVTALVNARRPGIDVRVIVDRSQLEEDRSDTYAVGRLTAGGVTILVDTVPGLMHNKVMIVDGETVATGSFNYTWSAEYKNAENLVLIHDPALAAEYTQNWNVRAARSRPLNSSASAESPRPQTAGADTAGVPEGSMRGNRRSMIYQWPGCPYYDAISASYRTEFPNPQAA